MARKRIRKQTIRHGWSRKQVYWLAPIAVVALVLGNWFAHLPTARRATFGALEPTLETLGAITAGVTDAFGLTGYDVAVPYVGTPSVRGPLPFGEPKVVDASKTPNDVVVLRRKGYWVGWSPSLGHPVWAAYSIPIRKLLEAPPPRPPFASDPEAPKSSHPSDYTGSGYDRGHMAPNYLIATRFGRAAQHETFLMSNIVPQRPSLNRGPWKRLEQIVADDLANFGDPTWVITGVVPNQKKHLKSSRVRVPSACYKIVCALHKGCLRVLAVQMPQELSEAKHPRYCLTSVDALEALTGLDFFSALSSERQEALERPEANRFWPQWELF